jgi:hypothetical protein
MARGLLGYGRYPDGHVGCPRAKTDMTPCVARDGRPAQDDPGDCVGCGAFPADLLVELVRAATADLAPPSDIAASDNATSTGITEADQ